MIKGYRKTGWGDADDKRGVDFFIDTGRRTIPIQVKHGGCRRRSIASFRAAGIYTVSGMNHRDWREELEKIILKAKTGIFR